MTPEVLPEENKPNPVDLARTSLNRVILTPDYDPAKLMAGINSLQSALLTSDLSPEKVFHELDVVSGLAREKSAGAGDQTFSELFDQMQVNFRQTHDRFTSKPLAPIQAPAPTRTETKLPMTAAKGVVKEQKTADPKTANELTKREAEIVEILKAQDAEFYSANEIARRVGILPSSVQVYISKIISRGFKVEKIKEPGNRRIRGYKIASEELEQASEEPQLEQSGSGSEETTGDQTDQAAE